MTLQLMRKRVIVTRPFGGNFLLRELEGGHEIDRVQTLDAQMILDYCEKMFEKGQVIEWIIVP